VQHILTQLVSCGADGVWSVWTLRNNEVIYRDDTHADKIWGLAVTGDGSCVVTGSSDSTVRIWDDVTVDVIAQQVWIFFVHHLFMQSLTSAISVFSLLCTVSAGR